MEVGKCPVKIIKWGCLFAVCALLLQTSLPLRAEIGSIRLYQRFGSPLVGYVATCRFDPTCSEFALAALTDYGFWQGNLKVVHRLLLCSPLGLILE
ncbi:MAG TPA: membrane protein insertion efficiency factor YidD [Acidobacteriota bacterium]|nr:membrane protein insertion efficiency factor YidD [Acidobacteriota bacterium]